MRTRTHLIFAFLILAVQVLGLQKVSGDQQTPIVFIHGIKGSVLALGDTVKWLTLEEALGLSTPQLSMPLTWQGDVQDRDEIKCQGILKEVVVIPFLKSEKIYGPWIETLHSLTRPHYEFCYDWRHDNNESLQKFESFLEWVKNKNGGAKIQVVAHSMGGLITLALLNKRPELFQSVLFAGVPFSGGIGFLPDIHQGQATGLNKKILSPSVLWTFPSVFSLFPFEKGAVINKDGSLDDAHFFAIDYWKSRKLGPYKDNSKQSPEFENHFVKALDQARLFREKLTPVKNESAIRVESPRLAVLLGNKFPTLVTVVKDGPQSIDGIDFETAPKAPGDGRVSVEQGLLPEALKPFEIFHTKFDHEGLLNDPSVKKIIEDLVSH